MNDDSKKAERVETDDGPRIMLYGRPWLIGPDTLGHACKELGLITEGELQMFLAFIRGVMN